MAKFDDKVNGNTVDATEYNNIVRSNKNTITDSGQTIDATNTQMSKAVANYAAVSTFYTDSGAANAYVLTAIGSFKPPSAYIDGLLIRFRAGNVNTGASTVNVGSLGVKNIKKKDGTTNPDAGDISTTQDSIYRFDSSNDAFVPAISNTKLPGDTVQIVTTQTGAVATGTTTMPFDDTIPQNTEGVEVLSQAITPTNSSNILTFQVTVMVSHSSIPNNMTVAIFQDSTANALGATTELHNSVDQMAIITFPFQMVAGTTSPTTFKVRVGCETAGTLTLNGQSGTRRHGGVAISLLSITETQV